VSSTLACAVLLLAGPVSASAAAPPGEPGTGSSAIDQYVEAIPTSSGPAPTGRAGTSRPLPPAVVAQVREAGGDDAETLLRTATSPSYGAPGLYPNDFRPGDIARADTEPSPLDAVVSPLAGADAPRLVFLLALLGAMTVTAFAVAARRQRR
jgi:hypothetical protein